MNCPVSGCKFSYDDPQGSLPYHSHVILMHIIEKHKLVEA
jgi:hypothetical protein